MLKNLYVKFFPMPKYLMAPSFGLDISDESLKFVELVPDKNGIKLGRYGERKIPPGVIESGQIKDSKKLQEVMMSLRKEEGIKFVRISLPEEQIYLFGLKLDKDGLENVRESIEFSLEEHIPIPAQDAIFDYEFLNQDEKKLNLQVAVIPKNVIENYLSVFKDSLISVQSCELEAQAIARAVIKKGDLETYMIVDFGKTRTGIFIVSHGLVASSSTLKISGEMLNDTIAKKLNITLEEAEKIKKEYGLQRNQENNEISSAVLESISVLRDEVVKRIIYWNTHKDEEGKDNPMIQKIILSGGDANLIGLPEYFSLSTKNKVEIGNIWVNVMDTTKNVPEVNFNRSLTFAAALGLALGDFEYD